MKIALGKSLEKSLGNISGNSAILLCFLVMELTKSGNQLSVAKIFSTIQLMVTLRLLLLFTVTSSSFLFQFNVTLERFCEIFNITNKRMIEIGPSEEELQVNLLQEKRNKYFSKNGFES